MLILLASGLASKANAQQGDPIAEEISQCIQACDEALIKAGDYIADLEKVNTLQYELLQRQEEKIKRIEMRNNQWFRDPLTMGLTGAVIGIILYSTVGGN